MSSKLQIPPEFDQAPAHQLPDEHLRIIDERLRESPTSPEGSRLWSEVEAELLAKRRRP